MGGEVLHSAKWSYYSSLPQFDFDNLIIYLLTSFLKNAARLLFLTMPSLFMNFVLDYIMISSLVYDIVVVSFLLLRCVPVISH